MPIGLALELSQGVEGVAAEDAVCEAVVLADQNEAELKEDPFLKAFLGKGRYKRLLNTIPVRVILNPQTALLGAASIAAGLAS